MFGQKHVMAMLAAAAFASLPGCQTVSDPPKAATQDVEFLRGCWVSKAMDGRVLGFLRLLPDGGEGPAYQGYEQSVIAGQTEGRVYYALARDGSTLTTRFVDPATGSLKEPLSFAYAPIPQELAAHLPAVEHRAVYAGAAGSNWMIFEGHGETLKMYTVKATGGVVSTGFAGERDGCD